MLIEITAVITSARSSSGVREVRTERREQILEAARRCFAGHGYQGATVVRLEEATGLSRGAISLLRLEGRPVPRARGEDNERLVQLWVEKGWEKTLREVGHEDLDWIGVYMEMGRKIRTDPEFKRRYEARTQESLAPPLLEHVRAEQKRGVFRADALAEQIAGFIGLVANGVAVQLGTGEPIRNVDALIEFVRSAVTDRAPTDTRRRTRP
ncbi:MAG: TetR/AcrR family transcriptional regulator [Actinomycetota bacterium]|nr:TetR/AcrR family transcriptional regulator [Actinomycetota bacterium]